jgi:hypothetical protein
MKGLISYLLTLTAMFKDGMPLKRNAQRLLIVLIAILGIGACHHDRINSYNLNDQTALPVFIEGPTRLQNFYAALQHQDYAFMWNMVASDAAHSKRKEKIPQDIALEFPGKAVGGTFIGRDVVIDRFIGLQLLVNNSLKFTYRWVGKSCDGGDREILEFYTTAEVPVNGVNHPYQNRGTVIVTFNKDNKIVEIHDYLDTEELVIVGQSDNKSNLDEKVQEARAKAGLPPSVYPQQQ